MKILVIDDDFNIRETLVAMLNTFCKGITEIAQADDINSGKIAIHSFKPDLLFIDVELKEKTAMDLLSDISNIDFPFFEMTEGVFTPFQAINSLSEHETNLFKKLIDLKFDSDKKTFHIIERQIILKTLID